MHTSLTLFQGADALMTHATRRLSHVAANVANADTPGYKARDLEPFSLDVGRNGSLQLRATRAGHLSDMTRALSPRSVGVEGPASPNGNTVSLEEEAIRAAEIRHQHEVAHSVYRTTMDVLRTSLGRGR